MKGRTWTEVQWGVLYRKGTPGKFGRLPGEIEYFGTKPGGDVGSYTEGEARYIAGNDGTRAVVRRIVVRTETMFNWEVS